MSRRTGGYLSLPDIVQQDCDLSATEKDILAVIGRRMGRQGVCVMGNEEIAKQIGVKHTDTVSRSVLSLAKKGKLKFLRTKRTTRNGKVENLKTIYCAKWAFDRNMRWLHWDKANLRELEASGKLQVIPPRKLRVPSPQVAGYNTTVHSEDARISGGAA